jgi:serine/threonine-protein kinase
MDFESGAMLTPTLRLVDRIGAGGMGTVWRADHLGLGMQVAVKCIDAELAQQAPELIARFTQEARTTAQIDSVHAVTAYEHGVTDDGLPYLVLELLRGSTLADWLALAGRLSGRETRLLVDQVGLVLERAHSLGIIHRDLKPANLFLVDGDDELFVKVLDFGVAKRLEKQGGDNVTATGVMMGTVEYMSPEQIRAAKHVDGRADLWSLASGRRLSMPDGHAALHGRLRVQDLLRSHGGQAEAALGNQPEAAEGSRSLVCACPRREDGRSLRHRARASRGVRNRNRRQALGAVRQRA